MFDEIKTLIQGVIKALKKQVDHECELIESEPKDSRYWKKGNSQKQYALSMVQHIFPKDKK